MHQEKANAKVSQKIAAILARMLVVAPETVKMDARYSELLGLNPEAVHNFAVRVEQTLGVTIGDSVIDAYPTVAELAAFCAKALADANGGRRYAVLCRMPDGSRPGSCAARWELPRTSLSAPSNWCWGCSPVRWHWLPMP